MTFQRGMRELDSGGSPIAIEAKQLSLESCPAPLGGPERGLRSHRGLKGMKWRQGEGAARLHGDEDSPP